MTNGLSHHLPQLVSKSALSQVEPAALSGSPTRIHSLSPAVRDGVIEVFSRSLHVAFFTSIPLGAILALDIVLFLKERHHRRRRGVALPGGRRRDEAMVHPAGVMGGCRMNIEDNKRIALEWLENRTILRGTKSTEESLGDRWS